jgi:hypothetical protein
MQLSGSSASRAMPTVQLLLAVAGRYEGKHNALT